MTVSEKALPQVAVVFDIDNSLVDWQDWGVTKNEKVFSRTVQAIRQYSEQLTVVFNTGRNLSSFKRIEQHLAPIETVHTAILCNGQEIYQKPDEQSFENWASHLTQSQQDAAWVEQLHFSTGWILQRVRYGLGIVLASLGFKRVSAPEHLPGYYEIYHWTDGKETLWVMGEADEPSLIFQSSQNHFPEYLKEKVSQVETAILEWLTGSQIAAEVRRYHFKKTPANAEHIECVHLWFEPQGTSKGSALAYWFTKHTNIDAVITVGYHHYNDCEVMAVSAYVDALEKSVPHFPILVNGDELLHQQVKAVIPETKIAYAEPGDLADALTQQLQRIQASLSLSA